MRRYLLAASLGVALVLQACGGVTPAAPDAAAASNSAVQSVATQAQSFQAGLQKAQDTFDGSATALLGLGKFACANIGTLDGLFQLVSPLVGVDTKGQTIHSAAIAGANISCDGISRLADQVAANPSATPANLPALVATAVNTVVAVKQNLATVAPTVAAKAAAAPAT